MKNFTASITPRANCSRRLRTVLTLILMTAISVFYFSPLLVQAAAGDLDSSFGVGGRVVTDVSGYTGESGQDVAFQPDGKILLAGYAQSSSNGTLDIVVLRYNSDGSLDTSFGVDGKVLTDFGNANDLAHAIALQVDGRIIVAGRAYTSGVSNFAVARYDVNGNLDPSFGIQGKTTIIFKGKGNKALFSWVRDIAIQFDGRIVLAGEADAKLGLARLNPDGALDPDFGINGKTIVSLSGGTGGSGAYTVAMQTVDSEERIVAAGYAATRRGVIDFALARFKANGTLDNSFDGDGKVITDFAGGEDLINDIVIDASNRIVAAGRCPQKFALARYNSDGTLDTTLDGDGKVATDVSASPDQGNSVTIQPDGKIVVAGVASLFSNGNFALVRYNADGSLDSSFGNNGTLTTDFSGHHDVAVALVMQPDNKIILVGSSAGFALARYVLD
jgi:uncharacterized delta-60 repeat protein